MAEPSDLNEPIPLSSIGDLPDPSGEIPLGDAAEPESPKKKLMPLGPPGVPMPRLWKAEPEPDPDLDDRPRKKKKKPADEPAEAPKAKKKDQGWRLPKKPKKVVADGEPKGVLIEETPKLDTHETRQRIRIAIGSGLTLFMLLAGYGIYRNFAPVPEPDETPVDPRLAVTGVAPVVNTQDGNELAARELLNRAREFAKNKKVEPAVSLLKQAVAKYPTTPAGVEAKEALDRPSRNLPLFPDRPVMSARGGTKTTNPSDEEKKAPEVIVDAAANKSDTAKGRTADILPPSNIKPPPSSGDSPATTANATPTPNYRKLPDGFHPRKGVEAHASGWPLEIVGDRDSEPMMLVQGTTFTQGRDRADPFEGPAHSVILGTYYIDQHEVTVRQFEVYQKEKKVHLPEREKALTKDPALANAAEDTPVVMVKFQEAVDYATWAGKRLPTEAQWEAAARGPDGLLFPWGNDPPNWSKPRKPRQIDPIGSFPIDKSPYGVIDLAGNAWEWTNDWYDAKYYTQFKTAPADNPTGPPKPAKVPKMVVKGVGKDWDVSKRGEYGPESRLSYLGFRCVLTVEGPGNVFDPPPTASPKAPATKPGQGQGGTGSPVPF